MGDDAGHPGAGKSGPGRPSLRQDLVGLLGDLPGLVGDRVHLLSLELRRATLSLGQMLALALLAAILVATAWLALWVGVAAGLIRAGMAWPWACLLVGGVNLLGALVAVWRVKVLAPRVALPATLRRLTDSDARERAAEEALRAQEWERHEQQRRERDAAPAP